jgi:hypothetical protein
VTWLTDFVSHNLTNVEIGEKMIYMSFSMYRYKLIATIANPKSPLI